MKEDGKAKSWEGMEWKERREEVTEGDVREGNGREKEEEREERRQGMRE